MYHHSKVDASRSVLHPLVHNGNRGSLPLDCIRDELRSPVKGVATVEISREAVEEVIEVLVVVVTEY